MTLAIEILCALAAVFLFILTMRAEVKEEQEKCARARIRGSHHPSSSK